MLRKEKEKRARRMHGMAWDKWLWRGIFEWVNLVCWTEAILHCEHSSINSSSVCFLFHLFSFSILRMWWVWNMCLVHVKMRVVYVNLQAFLGSFHLQKHQMVLDFESVTCKYKIIKTHWDQKYKKFSVSISGWRQIDFLFDTKVATLPLRSNRVDGASEFFHLRHAHCLQLTPNKFSIVMDLYIYIYIYSSAIRKRITQLRSESIRHYTMSMQSSIQQ